MAQKKRFNSLQGLRFICFMGVFLTHAKVTENPYIFNAISIFIMMSGFLMAYLYKSCPMDVGFTANVKFAVKKLKKLYPLHIITTLIQLVMTIVLTVYLDDFFEGFWISLGFSLALHLLLLHAWTTNEKIAFSFNGPSWYLSVVIFTYFMFPWILKLLKKIKKTSVFVIFSIAIMIVEYLLFILSANTGWLGGDFAHWVCTHCPINYLGVFVIGGNFGMIYSIQEEKGTIKKWNKFVGTLFELGILAVIGALYAGSLFAAMWSDKLVLAGQNVPFWYDTQSLLSAFVFPIAALLLVLMCVYNKGLISDLLAIKPLVWLGDVSNYSYLTHYVFSVIQADIGLMFGIYPTGWVFWVMVAVELVLSILTGWLYMKWSNRKKKPKKKHRNPFELVTNCVKKNETLLIGLVIFSAGGVVCRLLSTSYVTKIIDKITDTKNSGEGFETIRGFLVSNSIQMLLIAVGIAVLVGLTGLMASKIASNTGRDLREMIYHKIMSFSMPEADKISIPSLITRSTNDIAQVQNVLFLFLGTIITVPVMLIAGFLCMLDYAKGLGFTILIAAILVIVILVIFLKVCSPIVEIFMKNFDRMNQVTREGLSGVQVIRAFNREKWWEKRFYDASGDLRVNATKFNKVVATLEPTFYFIIAIVNVFAYWYAAYQVEDGVLSIGVVTAYSSYLYMIIMSLILMSTVMIQMTKVKVSVERLNEIMDMEPSIKDNEDAVEIDGKCDIEFRNVGFKYHADGGNVISNISFTAKAGETTAIIGNTGCGKTTIMNLIPRLYEASEGEVLIGGVNVKDVKLNSLRKSIGYVPQKSYLFTGDIESNVLYGADEETDKNVDEAIDISQTVEFVEKLDEGKKHKIAQGGSNVSGGQRQRVAIARAFARNPKVYLFDDSFSALDYKTDLAIRRAMKDKTKNATVLVVAQRVSTILKADQIIVMKNGRIVGIGKHEELLKDCDFYKEIVKSQIAEG